MRQESLVWLKIYKGFSMAGEHGGEHERRSRRDWKVEKREELVRGQITNVCVSKDL